VSGRITFVTNDPSWPARLAEQFHFLPAGTLPDLYTAGQVLSSLQPSLVLVDDRVANGLGPVEISTSLKAWLPHAQVVLLSGPTTAGLDLDIPGVTVLSQDMPLEELGQVIGLAPKAVAKSTVITITAMKGGVGKTTVALLVAAQLAQRKGRVVVWDCDFPQALVHQALKLPAEIPTIWDYLQDMSAPIEAFVRPSDAGIYVLPAPMRPDQIVVPDERLAREVVRDLCSLFEYVVLDNDAEIQKNPIVVTAAQELSDWILAVTDLEYFSLESFRRLMVALAGLGATDRVAVVANDGRRSGDRPKEIRRILKELGLSHLPFFLIPHASDVRRSHRTGKPPLLKEAGRLVDTLLERQ
jgi:MinD-like ATPase involved in chromosome partitioning or flagellar assembly